MEEQKYQIRTNEKAIFEAFESSKVTALLGARRVGKTTLVEHYVTLHPDRTWAVFNMDRLGHRQRVINEELEVMIEEVTLKRIGGEEKIWVFIDEAQKCPELFDQIKLLYDKHKGTDRIKFILTGSAHLNLHQLTAETLAGRVELFYLREYSLLEIAQTQNRDVSIPVHNAIAMILEHNDPNKIEETFLELRPYQQLLSKALETHLLWGGLPEILEEQTDRYRLTYLENYLQTYLEKEIRELHSIGDLTLYQNLMRIIAEQTGSLRNDTKITQALGCSRNTLQKYRGYLSATLLYCEIYPYMNSSLKRLVKSPKAYLTNNGLVSYLTGVHDLVLLESTGLIRHRFENWFLNAIRTWTDTVAEYQMLHFWRTTTGAEVDFILRLGNTIIPFEVTYSSHRLNKKVRSLKTFMDDELKAPFGVYCYTGPFHYDTENNIYFLPPWMI